MKTDINVPVILAAAMLLAASWGAKADETPEQVYEKYFSTVKHDGIAATADLIHPDELLRFKQILSPILESGDKQTRSAQIQDLFGKDATLESIKNMPAVDFYRGFMKIADAQSKSMNMSYGDTTVIGSISEGEVTHLVTRSTVKTGGFSLTRQEVISLKPYQGSWRLLLAGKLERMGQDIKAHMLNPKTKETKGE